jgi:hypothetical protein
MVIGLAVDMDCLRRIFKTTPISRTDSQLELNLDEELHKTYDPNIEK